MKFVIFGLLFGRRFGLEFGFPVGIFHAVDNSACRVFIQIMSGLIRRFTILARHAVTAKSGQIHHVNILHNLTVDKLLPAKTEGMAVYDKPKNR